MNKKQGILFLAVFLFFAPLILGYEHGKSDLIAGALLFLFGLMWLRWGIILVGMYLQLAPLIFWAKDPVFYVVDNVVGIIALVLAFVIPDAPYEEEEAIPVGWSYNPSSWSQRVVLIICATLCSILARMLSAYQMGYVTSIWDPFFDGGTVKVLTSNVSKSFPVSDAGLGAFAYTLDLILACHGGNKRWLETPWIVLIFALLVVPLAVVSLVLMVLQPVIVHAWCSLCLCAAFFMLILVTLTVDELVPVLQLLNRTRKKGKSVWKVLWHGETSQKSHATICCNKGKSSLFQGVSFSLSLFLCFLLAIWLLASPQVLQFEGILADITHVLGALVLTCSAIAFAEPLRSLRYLNYLFGCVLVIVSVLEHRPIPGIIAGLLLFAFSYFRGPIKEQYGSFQRYIK